MSKAEFIVNRRKVKLARSTWTAERTTAGCVKQDKMQEKGKTAKLNRKQHRQTLIEAPPDIYA